MPPSDDSRRRTILVVDDAAATLEVLQRNLEGAGYSVLTAPAAAPALHILERDRVDLVITDLKMPNVSGLELVRHVRDNLPDTEVMMITGFASVEGAVEALRSGAEDYLAKPFTDDELFAAVARALEKLRLREAATRADDTSARDRIVGGSPAAERLAGAVARAARTRANALLHGEDGSGRRHAARAIHDLGTSGCGRFRTVDCSAASPEELERALYGGRSVGPGGPAAAASDEAPGTLFLADVERSSPAVQSALLDLLRRPSSSALRDGSPELARVVASTCLPPADLERSGLVRPELLHLLGAVSIAVPPLRDRDDDAVILLKVFLRRYAAVAGRPEPAVPDRVIRAVSDYAWPGNIREVEALALRLVAAYDGRPVAVTDLPPAMRFSALTSRDTTRQLSTVEAEYVASVLASVDGNRTRAAKILGIDRKTLRDKLRRGTPD